MAAVSFRLVIGRGLLFVAWALLGAVVSYGALYALSPYGLAILTVCLLVALVLPAAGGSRWPECLGLLAGPGVFCFVAAYSANDPAGFIVVGLAFIAAALLAYTLVGRARCMVR